MPLLGDAAIDRHCAAVLFQGMGRSLPRLGVVMLFAVDSFFV